MKKLLSPGLFIILYFICQITIDCLGSVTAFPFFHSGMYSEVYQNSEVTIFQITVDGKSLKSNDFGILNWDMICSPLFSFQKQTNSNDFAFDKKAIKKGMQWAGLKFIYNEVEPHLSNTDLRLTTTFPAWYKKHLSHILNRNITMIEIDRLHYSYKNRRYLLLKKEKWITI